MQIDNFVKKRKLKMNKIQMAGPSITQHEMDVVADAMRNWYDNPYYYVEKFQDEFAEYHNRKYAVMTPNCTTAIHLLLTCLGIKEGDEVIVPECTWIASAAPITYLKAKPVFCDISADHWCLSADSVERNITEKTKAIIAVDLYGNMPDMEDLTFLSKRYNIPLIEDAAEAVGSKYFDKPAGSFGVGSVFSFHRTKTITTGEGGMLLLDDEELYKKCMIWRDHGRDAALPQHMRETNQKEYFNKYVTYKYMPFNIQAALGHAQFQRLDEIIAKKRRIFQMYKERLSNIADLQFNEESDYVYNGVWATALVFGKSHKMTKEVAIKKLEALGVPSRPFFYPLSSLPAFPGYDEEEYKNKSLSAYDISSRGINLPCALNLTEEQIDFICDGIRRILE